MEIRRKDFYERSLAAEAWLKSYFELQGPTECKVVKADAKKAALNEARLSLEVRTVRKDTGKFIWGVTRE